MESTSLAETRRTEEVLRRGNRDRVSPALGLQSSAATKKGIHLIVDSTGLSIVGEGEWAAAKHGERGKQAGGSFTLLWTVEA